MRLTNISQSSVPRHNPSRACQYTSCEIFCGSFRWAFERSYLNLLLNLLSFLSIRRRDLKYLETVIPLPAKSAQHSRRGCSITVNRNLVEQQADTFSIVRAANALGDHGTDINNAKFLAKVAVLLLRNRVRHLQKDQSITQVQ